MPRYLSAADASTASASAAAAAATTAGRAWMAAMRLVSATATLYNTPSLSLSLSLSEERPRQLVSKKEAASSQGSSLLSPLLSNRPPLVTAPFGRAERLYDTQESPTEGREGERDGRTAGGFATKQTRKQAKARYRRRRRLRNHPARARYDSSTGNAAAKHRRERPLALCAMVRRERERGEGREGEGPKKTLLTEAERGRRQVQPTPRPHSAPPTDRGGIGAVVEAAEEGTASAASTAATRRTMPASSHCVVPSYPDSKRDESKKRDAAQSPLSQHRGHYPTRTRPPSILT